MKRFFRKMKRMDERILNSLHIRRSVHLAKLMVQFAPPVGAGFIGRSAATIFWSTPVSNTRSCSASAHSLPRRDGSCLRLVPCFSSFISDGNGL